MYHCSKHSKCLMNSSSESQYFDVDIMWNSRKLWNSVTTGQKSSKPVKIWTRVDWKICSFCESTLGRFFVIIQSTFERPRLYIYLKEFPCATRVFLVLFQPSRVHFRPLFACGSVWFNSEMSVRDRPWDTTYSIEKFFRHHILSMATGDELGQCLRRVTIPHLLKLFIKLTL